MYIPEKLIFQASLGDSEVDDGHLDANLGQVMRVGHLCGHVKLEILVVLEIAITKTNKCSTTLKNNMTLKTMAG